MAQFTKKVVSWENSNISDVRDSTKTRTLTLLNQVLCGLYYLQSSSPSLISQESLIQVWIPGENDKTLFAMDCPHGIAYEEGSRAGHKLQLYRKESCKRGIEKNVTLTHDCRQFSSQINYLHDEIAKLCEIQGSKFFPVFSSSSAGSPCIAVLEIVTTRADPDFGIEEYKDIKKELQKVNMTTSNNAGYFFQTDEGPGLAAQGLLQQESNLSVRPAIKGKNVVNLNRQIPKATQNHNGPNKSIIGAANVAAQNQDEPYSSARSSRKDKEAVNSNYQIHEATENHNVTNKNTTVTALAQDPDESYSLVRSSRKGKEVVHSNCQFHETTQNHHGTNKHMARNNHVDSDSSIGWRYALTVSARSGWPKRKTRIFHYKFSMLTIEGLYTEIANGFQGDDIAISNFHLYIIEGGKMRDLPIHNEEQLRTYYEDWKHHDSIFLVIDVKILDKAKRKKKGNPNSNQGVTIDITPEEFIKVYEAVDNKIDKKTKRTEIVRKIIRAGPSTVKGFIKRFLGKGEEGESSGNYPNAALEKKRKRGESIGKPNGAEQELPPLEPEKEKITRDDVMVSDYDVEQIEVSVMEGNEDSANINRMPVPVRFNNGNMSRELGATAEQEAEQHDLNNLLKDVQSGAEVIADRNCTDQFAATREQEANDMLVEEFFSAYTNEMGMDVDLGAPLWINEDRDFEVLQGMMGIAPEQQLGEATAWSDKELYDDDFWVSFIS